MAAVHNSDGFKIAQLLRRDIVREGSNTGFVYVASGKEDGDGDREVATEGVGEAVTEWRNAEFSMQGRVISDRDESALFWRSTGRTFFRVASVISRSVLGAPSSVAVLGVISEWPAGSSSSSVA